MNFKTFLHRDNMSDQAVSTALLIMRIAVGVIFIIHGYGKLFGDAPGIEGFTGMLQGLQVPAPLFFAWIVALVEFVGGILVLAGAFVRPFGLALAIIMLVAFLLTKNGQLPAGDADVALLALSLALAKVGAGRYTLKSLFKR